MWKDVALKRVSKFTSKKFYGNVKIIKHFILVADALDKQGWVLGKHFQPSLIFATKAQVKHLIVSNLMFQALQTNNRLGWKGLTITVGKIPYVVAPNVSKQSEDISKSIPIIKIVFRD